MLSHISVLPLLLEWMQGSRSVGRVIRLVVDYEGSGRRSRTCWQEEGRRAGCGRRACWLWKEYEFHEDVRRAGEGGNVDWQVR